MNYKDISREARKALTDGGFVVGPDLRDCGLSLDMLACRGDRMLLIKAHGDVGGISAHAADEFRTLAEAAGAVPLILAADDLNSGEEIQPCCVHIRHGICAISPETLRAYTVDGELPMAISSKGYTLRVMLIPGALREAREAAGITRPALARAIGMGEAEIRRYESGLRTPTLDAALDLEEYLGAELIEPQDIFSKTYGGAEDPSLLTSSSEGPS